MAPTCALTLPVEQRSDLSDQIRQFEGLRDHRSAAEQIVLVLWPVPWPLEEQLELSEWWSSLQKTISIVESQGEKRMALLSKLVRTCNRRSRSA